ncbi:hypothetical protein, conserved [Trypanosoma brucei gambiense DAL972]|uniref:Uncharacterized protein n=1 Tax=Trypanosoma brucei gambiense (strain MHOM/CI/86/DAL972) TaxID=679716 RepID=C9ZU81_TRYB9|nr:hypothetical protein, conserved [Trypanosoma brucei gambiense DAL972]CBH12967.1 hypothetical protein, conserved [Trypanosoma brucei gambiense DAL972]|eukprot:XP_011775246.1 hypothetical protein, conserved [Trypanosoma brucei gambiense DAL972]
MDQKTQESGALSLRDVMERPSDEEALQLLLNEHQKYYIGALDDDDYMSSDGSEAIYSDGAIKTTATTTTMTATRTTTITTAVTLASGDSVSNGISSRSCERANTCGGLTVSDKVINNTVYYGLPGVVEAFNVRTLSRMDCPRTWVVPRGTIPASCYANTVTEKLDVNSCALVDYSQRRCLVYARSELLQPQGKAGDRMQKVLAVWPEGSTRYRHNQFHNGSGSRGDTGSQAQVWPQERSPSPTGTQSPLYWPAYVTRVVGVFEDPLLEVASDPLFLNTIPVAEAAAHHAGSASNGVEKEGETSQWAKCCAWLKSHNDFNEVIEYALTVPMRICVDVTYCIDEISEGRRLTILPSVRYATPKDDVSSNEEDDQEVLKHAEHVCSTLKAGHSCSCIVRHESQCPILTPEQIPEVVSIRNYSHTAILGRRKGHASAAALSLGWKKPLGCVTEQKSPERSSSATGTVSMNHSVMKSPGSPRRARLNGDTLSQNPITALEMLAGPICQAQQFVFLRPNPQTVAEAQRAAIEDLRALWMRLHRPSRAVLKAEEEAERSRFNPTCTPPDEKSENKTASFEYVPPYVQSDPPKNTGLDTSDLPAPHGCYAPEDVTDDHLHRKLKLLQGQTAEGNRRGKPSYPPPTFNPSYEGPATPDFERGCCPHRVAPSRREVRDNSPSVRCRHDSDVDMTTTSDRGAFAGPVGGPSRRGSLCRNGNSCNNSFNLRYSGWNGSRLNATTNSSMETPPAKPSRTYARGTSTAAVLFAEQDEFNSTEHLNSSEQQKTENTSYRDQRGEVHEAHVGKSTCISPLRSRGHADSFRVEESLSTKSKTRMFGSASADVVDRTKETSGNGRTLTTPDENVTVKSTVLEQSAVPRGALTAFQEFERRVARDVRVQQAHAIELPRECTLRDVVAARALDVHEASLRKCSPSQTPVGKTEEKQVMTAPPSAEKRGNSATKADREEGEGKLNPLSLRMSRSQLEVQAPARQQEQQMCVGPFRKVEDSDVGVPRHDKALNARRATEQSQHQEQQHGSLTSTVKISELSNPTVAPSDANKNDMLCLLKQEFQRLQSQSTSTERATIESGRDPALERERWTPQAPGSLRSVQERQQQQQRYSENATRSSRNPSFGFPRDDSSVAAKQQAVQSPHQDRLIESMVPVGRNSQSLFSQRVSPSLSVEQQQQQQRQHSCSRVSYSENVVTGPAFSSPSNAKQSVTQHEAFTATSRRNSDLRFPSQPASLTSQVSATPAQRPEHSNENLLSSTKNLDSKPARYTPPSLAVRHRSDTETANEKEDRRREQRSGSDMISTVHSDAEVTVRVPSPKSTRHQRQRQYLVTSDTSSTRNSNPAITHQSESHAYSYSAMQSIYKERTTGSLLSNAKNSDAKGVRPTLSPTALQQSDALVSYQSWARVGKEKSTTRNSDVEVVVRIPSPSKNRSMTHYSPTHDSNRKSSDVEVVVRIPSPSSRRSETVQQQSHDTSQTQRSSLNYPRTPYTKPSSVMLKASSYPQCDDFPLLRTSSHISEHGLDRHRHGVQSNRSNKNALSTSRGYAALSTSHVDCPSPLPPAAAAGKFAVEVIADDPRLLPQAIPHEGAGKSGVSSR